MKKCNDCNSKETLSQRFMRELSLGKLIAIFGVVIGVVFSAGAGSNKLYASMGNTKTNTQKIDSALVVMHDFHINLKKIADALVETGDIQEGLVYKEADTTMYVAEVIYPKEDKKKRTCLKDELSTIEKDFKD